MLPISALNPGFGVQEGVWGWFPEGAARLAIPCITSGGQLSTRAPCPRPTARLAGRAITQHSLMSGGSVFPQTFEEPSMAHHYTQLFIRGVSRRGSLLSEREWDGRSFDFSRLNCDPLGKPCYSDCRDEEVEAHREE